MIDLQICHCILGFLKILHQSLFNLLIGRNTEFFFHKILTELFKLTVIANRLQDSFHKSFDTDDYTFRYIVNFFDQDTTSLTGMTDITALNISQKIISMM